MTKPAILGRTVSFTIALTACFALTACGSIVDSAAAEKQATEGIPDLAESDLAIDSVSCPEDVEFTTGNTFDCDYVVEDGSEGVVSFEIRKDEDYSATIASYASGQIADYLLNNDEDAEVALASVECDDPIEDEYECSFEDEEGDTGTITVTLTGDGGFETAAEYD